MSNFEREYENEKAVYWHEASDSEYSEEDLRALDEYDDLDYDQRQRVLQIFDDETLENFGIIPEGWSNWSRDPDLDPDAWDMPDSWYGE